MTIKEEFNGLFDIAHTQLSDIQRTYWFAFLFDMLQRKMTEEDIEMARTKLKKLGANVPKPQMGGEIPKWKR